MALSSLKFNKNLSGILLMVLHTIAVSMIYVCIKKVEVVISPNIATLLLKLTTFLLVTIWCMNKGFLACIRTKNLKLHFARGIMSAAASLCFYNGLKYLDLGTATSLTMLEGAIVVLIGFFYFKEKVTYIKIITVLLSFFGVLLATKPTINFNLGYSYIVLALLFWVLNNMFIKKLGRSEHSEAQLFYSTGFASIVCFITVFISYFLSESSETFLDVNLFNGIFDKTIILLIIGSALCTIVHKVAFFRSLKLADLSVVMPFDYSRQVFGALFAYLFFDTVYDYDSILGYSVIILSGIMLVLSEGKRLYNK